MASKKEQHLLGALFHIAAYANNGNAAIGGKLKSLFFNPERVMAKKAAPRKRTMKKTATVKRTPAQKKEVKVTKGGPVKPKPLVFRQREPKSSLQDLAFISTKNPLPSFQMRQPVNMG